MFRKLWSELVDPFESDEEGELEEGQRYLDEELNKEYDSDGLDLLPSFGEWPTISRLDMFGAVEARQKNIDSRRAQTPPAMQHC